MRELFDVVEPPMVVNKWVTCDRSFTMAQQKLAFSIAQYSYAVVRIMSYDKRSDICLLDAPISIA